MKVEAELIFPGARVKMGDTAFTVVKVNAKSFYATTMSFADYTEKWNLKAKGTTFLAFCKFYDIKQYKYDGSFEIEETEFNRKELAEANSKSIYKIDSFDKGLIIERIKTLKKKKGKVVMTPQISLRGKNSLFFLAENGNNYLANIDGDYVMFSLDTDEWIKISTVFDYKEKFKEVPWELLSSTKMVKTA